MTRYYHVVAEVQRLILPTAQTQGKSDLDLASNFVNFEISLLNSSIPASYAQQLYYMPVDDAQYHKLSLQDLSTQISSQLNWTALFIEMPELWKQRNLGFMIPYPDQMAYQASMITKASLSTIREYLKIHVMLSAMPNLDSVTRAKWFAWWRWFTGQSAEKSREDLCDDSITSGMPWLVSHYFAERTMDSQEWKKADVLIDNIRSAFKTNMETMSWLDSTTKTAALSKLAAITQKVGYPVKWDEYQSVMFSKGVWFENVLRLSNHLFNYQMSTLGSTPTRSDWLMPPTTLNAWYMPTQNSITIPAAILQDPMFTAEMLPFNAYGHIGYVIGHEFTHGFDNNGRKYDNIGQKADWWTAAATAAFNTRANCLVSQYGKFYVGAASAYVDGTLTLGENIADQGGIANSYKAYTDTTSKTDVKNQMNIVRAAFQNKFTNEQLYWVAAGQTWCSKMTPEALKSQIANDPHSPARYRVIGPLQNNDNFHQDFNCASGTYMNPKSKCAPLW